MYILASSSVFCTDIGQYIGLARELELLGLAAKHLDGQRVNI